jgi:general secretion pathway protein H
VKPVIAIRRRTDGFTLLELLIVLTLIAGIAGLAMFNIAGRLDSVRVVRASNEVAALLRHTRAQAIVGHSEQVLDLDLETRTVTAPGRKPVVLPQSLAVSIYTANQEIASEKRGAIRFYPDGGSTGGRIKLNANGREWKINVSWLTGEITVDDSAKTKSL